MAVNPWKEVRGHKNWWQYEFAGGHVRYMKYSPLFKGGQSPIFIAKEKHPLPFKYTVLESGASPSGGAALRGGAKTLKEAIALAEKFEKR
jgi:hypothetical protein